MTTSRFPSDVSIDNTDRVLDNLYLNPAYAASLAVAPRVSNTLVQVQTLTGALAVTVGVGSSTKPPFVGDNLRFLLVSDGTTRTVTFSTGFVANGTLAVTTAKFSTIAFIFNGTAWQETGRTTTA